MPLPLSDQERLYVSPKLPEGGDGGLPIDPSTLPDVGPSLISDGGQFSAGNSTVNSIVDKLLGTNGQERYQLWPERLIRDAISAPHDIAQQNPYPEGSEQFYSFEDSRQKAMLPAAMNMAALAGTGGLGGVGEGAASSLGSAPFLRPALKYEGKIYKAPVGGEHMDAIPKELQGEFTKQAMSGEDISNFNFGFMNHKGQFLDREKALKYAIDEGLLSPHDSKYGALTSTLMADSSKEAAALDAAKSQQPFYSIVEKTVANADQNKMTGNQWLGTLNNKPGVKPEEMQYTGLQDFLKERGSQPVTKAEVQEHLTNNKVQVNEVNKGNGLEKSIHDDLEKSIGNSTIVKGEKLYPDEIISSIYNGDLKPSDLPTHLQDKAQALLDAKAARNDPTKYHSYQLPGGENYREKLLTLPSANNLKSDRMTKIESLLQSRPAGGEAERAALRDEYKKLTDETRDNPTYKSSHWDEPNILAHIRTNDRTVEGKDALHVEEIQSDWHQQGRDKGYKSKETDNKLGELKTKIDEAQTAIKNAEKETWLKETNGKFNNATDYINSIKTDGSLAHAKAADEFNRITKLADENQKQFINKSAELVKEHNDINNKASEIPDAPFKKSWPELAMKRIIRQAVEEGKDRVSWTPGEAQAARYNLSKQVQTVVYKDGNLTAIGPTGHHVINNQAVPKEKLPDYIGKEAAEKLMNQEPHNGAYSLQGEQLKVGGEGMKGFYDQMLPNIVEKLGKKYGVKVKEGNVKGLVPDPDNKYINMQGNQKVKYFDIPKEMKQDVLKKGFSLFSNPLPIPSQRNK